jgi:PGF-CTERM protein
MPDWSLPPTSGLVTVLIVVGLVAGATGVVVAQESSVELATQDERVVVPPAEDATITGTSNLDAGSNLTVRVQSAGDTQPQFLKTQTVAVAENGSFAAPFDFSEQASGDAFAVTVVRDGETVAESEGVVLAPGDASATADASTTGDGTDASTPGFGLVAALVALVAVAGYVRFR